MVGAVEEVGTRVPVGEPVVVVRGGVVVVVVVLEVVELDVPLVEGVVTAPGVDVPGTVGTEGAGASDRPNGPTTTTMAATATSVAATSRRTGVRTRRRAACRPATGPPGVAFRTDDATPASRRVVAPCSRDPL